MERLGNGDIHIWYHIKADSASAYGADKGHACSADEGRSFVPVKKPPLDGGILLPNGDRIRDILLPALDTAALKLPEPRFVHHDGYNNEYQILDAAKVPAEYSGYPVERLARGDSVWKVREPSKTNRCFSSPMIWERPSPS
ncbi:MAG: hypothetical protein LBU00_01350 [Treponema sp.]|nr:hypothetical protein [Treponema sp.]